MTALHEDTAYIQSQPLAARSRFGAPGQSVLLAMAGVTALLALVVGVVAAYLVFPEPTMWRIAVNGLFIAIAVFPIRRLVRRGPSSSKPVERRLITGESDRFRP